MSTLPTGDGAVAGLHPGVNAGGFGTGFNHEGLTPAPSPFALVDMFIPGFSLTVSTVQRYLGIDLTLYLPLFLIYTGLTIAWQYLSGYIWDLAETYLMSVCELRPDDELYFQVLSWIAAQRFAQRSRRFIANSSLTGRWWWYWDDSEDDEDFEDLIFDEDNVAMVNPDRRKPLSYTPSFGSHSFWFRGHFLRFTRVQNREQSGFLMASEKEEISISCFGRNPDILKELLLEARREHFKKDEQKTFIYRGTSRNGGDVSWQRCMSRTPRPFSTVILDEGVKKDLIADMTDYLNPSTRRWYSNRGIPYRRGYLLYGPPGTGKSSLSLALAGFFKMRIYIVSLSSSSASEENLSNLFAELPRRCVVLLEDIDTAGLTHTREDNGSAPDGDTADEDDNLRDTQRKRKLPSAATNNNNSSRLSLSGLLNILDGVASQEGRILIMTTNHLEKLDKALIRPGRVDMVVKFGLADASMASAIFRAIYCPKDVDDKPTPILKQLGPQRAAGNQELLDTKPMPDNAQAAEGPTDIHQSQQSSAQVTAGDSKADNDIEKKAIEFAGKISPDEFSPAEIQGFLLKHKRDPDGAVAHLEEWMTTTRLEKTSKAVKDAAKSQRRRERQKKEEAKLLKKEMREKEKKKRKKAKKRKAKEEKRAKRKAESEAAGETPNAIDDVSSSDTDSDSDSDSDSSSESGVELDPTPIITPASGVSTGPEATTIRPEGESTIDAVLESTREGASTMNFPDDTLHLSDGARSTSLLPGADQQSGTESVSGPTDTDIFTPLGFIQAHDESHRRQGADSGYGSPNIGIDELGAAPKKS
jgi:chaperone BCS1